MRLLKYYDMLLLYIYIYICSDFKAVVIAEVFINVLIPVCIITICYAWIILVIWRRERMGFTGPHNTCKGNFNKTCDTATFLCLSQTQIWDSNEICRGIFCAQWFETSSGYSFCWYWRICWPSLFKLSFLVYSALLSQLLRSIYCDCCNDVVKVFGITVRNWYI
jgi:hypothetical protein